MERSVVKGRLSPYARCNIYTSSLFLCIAANSFELLLYLTFLATTTRNIIAVIVPLYIAIATSQNLPQAEKLSAKGRWAL